MPELPEVETIVRQLNRSLTGQVIKSFECDWVKMIKPLSLIKFKKNVLGAKVVAVKRRAKVILIDFKNGHLAIHLKMTGQLVYMPKHGKVVVGGHPIAGLKELDPAASRGVSGRVANREVSAPPTTLQTPLSTRQAAVVSEMRYNTPNKSGSRADFAASLPDRFTHAMFIFKNGARLYFNDVRKFGWIKWLRPEEHLELHEGFGLDGLSDSAKILEVLLKNKNRFPKKSLKGYLLDQTVISGLGNIYADEVCFMAGILPSRQVKNVSNADWKNISKLIPKILNKSIRLGGTTFSTYRDANGQQGSYWKSRLVYGRAGEKCKKCGSIIKKTIVASRGTSYCPKCQS